MVGLGVFNFKSIDGVVVNIEIVSHNQLEGQDDQNKTIWFNVFEHVFINNDVKKDTVVFLVLKEPL